MQTKSLVLEGGDHHGKKAGRNHGADRGYCSKPDNQFSSFGSHNDCNSVVAVAAITLTRIGTMMLVKRKRLKDSQL